MDQPKYEPSATPEDKSFIMEPDNWPRWPFLPLKRRRPGNLMPQLGMLIDKGDPRKIGLSFPVLCRVFKPESTTEVEVEKSYDSLDELVADGWIVD